MKMEFNSARYQEREMNKNGTAWTNSKITKDDEIAQKISIMYFWKTCWPTAIDNTIYDTPQIRQATWSQFSARWLHSDQQSLWNRFLTEV